MLVQCPNRYALTTQATYNADSNIPIVYDDQCACFHRLLAPQKTNVCFGEIRFRDEGTHWTGCGKHNGHRAHRVHKYGFDRAAVWL